MVSAQLQRQRHYLADPKIIRKMNSNNQLEERMLCRAIERLLNHDLRDRIICCRNILNRVINLKAWYVEIQIQAFRCLLLTSSWLIFIYGG